MLYYIYFAVVHIILIYLFSNEAIEDEKISPLAMWLRSPEHTPPPKRVDNKFMNNPILILVWKYGSKLKRRHIHRFQSNASFSPWDGCSVNNCQLSYDDKDLERADAVLFHLHAMRNEDAEEISLWSRHKRRPNQLWIFLTDESPKHTVLYQKYDGIFNWSMNYRMDSDIPVPYGRTIRRHNEIYNNINTDDNFDSIMKKKTKLVTIMGSNCANYKRSGSHRWEYVRELFEYLPGQLDIFGHCMNGNKTACPGHFATDCPLLNNYKFYLAFENSNCQEYMTEKVFWNAYSKYSVPVIMGASRNDCNKLLPPHSYIHIEDFESPRDLADYLLMLDLSDDAYYGYHKWRYNYIVLNEHGYFGSVSRHYCRLCEGLHYNPVQPSKTYENLTHYWDPNTQCFTDV